MVLRPFPLPQLSDDRSQAPVCRAFAKPGRNDEIGPPTLCGIRNLCPQNVCKPLLGHPGSAQYPLALKARRRRYDQDIIATYLTPDFEQQRDIEHDQLFAPSSGGGDDPPLDGANPRMQERFKPPQRRRIAEHTTPELLAIYTAGLITHAGKRRLDGAHCTTARCQQPVDLGIGIV
jgi:hypothetical protein